nr:hypothetical protein [Prevotella sp.]
MKKIIYTILNFGLCILFAGCQELTDYQNLVSPKTDNTNFGKYGHVYYDADNLLLGTWYLKSFKSNDGTTQAGNNEYKEITDTMEYYYNTTNGNYTCTYYYKYPIIYEKKTGSLDVVDLKISLLDTLYLEYTTANEYRLYTRNLEYSKTWYLCSRNGDDWKRSYNGYYMSINGNEINGTDANGSYKASFYKYGDNWSIIRDNISTYYTLKLLSSKYLVLSNGDTNYYFATADGITSISTEDTPEEYSAVDMGLSVKWASFNVGATKPEDYGGLYGWADPTGTKTSTTNNDYPSANPPSNISGTEYDIAHVKWGGKWRIPTNDELNELMTNCKISWTTLNGVNGNTYTSKKNGNVIFLPAAGYRYGSSTIKGRGTYGRYYSGTLNPNMTNNAYDMLFSNSSDDWNGLNRYDGRSIRPVLPY